MAADRRRAAGSGASSRPRSRRPRPGSRAGWSPAPATSACGPGSPAHGDRIPDAAPLPAPLLALARRPATSSGSTRRAAGARWSAATAATCSGARSAGAGARRRPGRVRRLPRRHGPAGGDDLRDAGGERPLHLVDSFAGMPRDTEGHRPLRGGRPRLDLGRRRARGARPLPVRARPRGRDPADPRGDRSRARWRGRTSTLTSTPPSATASSTSTRACVPGGSIVLDDYGFPSCPGARRAVDEFFAAPPGGAAVPSDRAVPRDQAAVARRAPAPRRGLGARLAAAASTASRSDSRPSCSSVGAFYFWTALQRPSRAAATTRYLAEGFADGETEPAASSRRRSCWRSTDPYDPVQNAPYRLHDAILYDGHFYLYFGPSPGGAALPASGPSAATSGDRVAAPLLASGGFASAAVLLLFLIAPLRPRHRDGVAAGRGRRPRSRATSCRSSCAGPRSTRPPSPPASSSSMLAVLLPGRRGPARSAVAAARRRGQPGPGARGGGAG